jgi:hypothetical protein
MALGRPPKYETPEELETAIDSYFAKCEADERDITMSGLAYHLGFNSRNSLYNYEDKEVFNVPIKRALLRIEQAYEERLYGGQCTGAIFALKNRGWRDTQTIDDVSSRKPETVTINWVGDAG